MTHLDQLWNTLERDREVGTERAMSRLFYDFQLHARFGTDNWRAWAALAENLPSEPYPTFID